MALSTGQKLGPYEIVAPIGAGGMGEVYRARDTRLERDVAIKVLPASLSQNPQVEARFAREAKTISSLNHPHICVLHDIGHEGDVAYLVMELIEGETLADRIEKGPLPPGEVLKIGGQIADALDRAHRASVVHRDLKPTNVMLTRSGAKLMDFGLARAADAPVGTGDASSKSQSPTVAQPLTAEGAIVGTFQYMAPEQLEGKEADQRADLWALGCVLYEMATGKRAFCGESQASLIGSIMHADPRPVSALAPLAPVELDRLVAGCLTKNADDRVQSAHDVKLQLTWLAEGSSSTATGVAAAVPVPPRAAAMRPGWIVPAAVALVSVALTVLVMTFGPFDGEPTPASSPVQRFILGSAELQPTSVPIFSPDGTYVVVSVMEGISRRLYRRNLSDFEMTPIAGTEDGQAPFFSPDGAWLAFVTPDAVKRVPVDGGVSQVISSTPRASAGDWGEDGTIFLTHRTGGPDGTTALTRVAVSGGQPEVVATLDASAGETESWLPEILPDGKTVLISILGGGTPKIVAVREDGSRHTVVENAFLGRHVESGHLLYQDMGSEAVVVVAFDPTSAQSTGTAVALTEPVDGAFCYDVAADGKLVYVPLPGAGEGDELVWLDREGTSIPAVERRATWVQPRVSPDGKRVVLRKTATNCELWMLDVDRGSLARIVHGGDSHDPVWAPDGTAVLYHELNSDKLVTQTVGGARKVETIAQGTDAGPPTSWSSNGNLLAYTLRDTEKREDIWIRAVDGSSPAEPFLATEFSESRAAFSPDGRWIAYVSDESGGREVFVRSYPDSGSAWQISTSGGRDPIWSRDGDELYFVSGRKLMAVPVTAGSSFQAGRAVELFEGRMGSDRLRDFDIAPDGRFISVRTAGGDDGGQELRMLTSWQQEMLETSGGGGH